MQEESQESLKFACIGSRQTPGQHLQMMEALGQLIAKDGHRVVSGNCKGADQAFQRGANKIEPKKVLVYLPWKSYEIDALVVGNEVELDVSDGAIELAREYHPFYQYLKRPVKMFMNRNAAIVMNSDYVFAYLNHEAKGHGGTGHGWRVAGGLNIPRKDLSQIDLSKGRIDSVAENLYKEALEVIRQRRD